MDNQNQFNYDTSKIIPIKELHFDIVSNDIVQKSALADIASIKNVDLYERMQGPKRGELIENFEEKKQQNILTPEIIVDILDNISSEDRIILGFDSENKSSDTIKNVFSVPPVIVRPLKEYDEKEMHCKPLVERFKGMHGRIRKNLMGIRGDYNARTNNETDDDKMF